jgi:3-oxoadipate enol-lactonase
MTLELDGVRIGFDSRGSGPAVLFLHAFPLSAAMWAPQEAALAERFQVVRVDARGFGASDIGSVPLSMERIAADAAAVLDHLGLSRATVVGCSMGGYAALAFARGFASRLAGLVLVDTKAAADTDEARAGRAVLAQNALARGPIAVVEAMLPKLLGTTTQRERPQVVEAVRVAIDEASPSSVANALQAMAARPDSRPGLKDIRVPTLVVRGAEDAVIPEADARALQEGVAGSRWFGIPGAGHLPNLETPAAFNDALTRFLVSV